MSAMGDETEWFSFSFFQSIIMNIYYLHNHTQKLSFWLILSFLTEKGRRANSHKFYDVHYVRTEQSPRSKIRFSGP